MIIDCISDLHGYYPKLEGGDLLIVAGDLTARDTLEEFERFIDWVWLQKYSKVIVVGGNHDNCLNYDGNRLLFFCGKDQRMEYLCDSGTELEGLNIWGAPWTKTFPGMNPHCMAFTEPFGCDQEEWLAEHWNKIPENIDILITHSPPFGILDETIHFDLAGSKSLLVKVAEIKPLIHCFGHIHENGGKTTWIPWKNGTKFINCSHVNERYQPVNKPVRVIL